MPGAIAANLPVWALAAVLALPLLDVLHSLSPWSRRLWVEHDHAAWVPFWGVVAGLRWLQAGAAAGVLLLTDVPLDVVGLRLPSLPVLAGSVLVALVGLGWYVHSAWTAPTVTRGDAPTDLTTTYPADAGERLLWFASGGVTAPIAEEFVYRGVALTGLIGLGAPWPLAILVAALAFALAHGFAAFNLVAGAVYLSTATAFSLLVLVTGSLLPAIAVHSAWNHVAAGRDLRTTSIE